MHTDYGCLLYGCILFFNLFGTEGITWPEIKNAIDFVQNADLHHG